MQVVDDRTEEVLVEGDFAGVEQIGHTLNVFFRQGYTMKLGYAEWERLCYLMAKRYTHKPKDLKEN